MVIFFLPAMSLRSASECPCTSADGDSTLNISASNFLVLLFWNSSLTDFLFLATIIFVGVFVMVF